MESNDEMKRGEVKTLYNRRLHSHLVPVSNAAQRISVQPSENSSKVAPSVPPILQVHYVSTPQDVFKKFTPKSPTEFLPTSSITQKFKSVHIDQSYSDSESDYDVVGDTENANENLSKTEVENRSEDEVPVPILNVENESSSNESSYSESESSDDDETISVQTVSNPSIDIEPDGDSSQVISLSETENISIASSQESETQIYDCWVKSSEYKQILRLFSARNSAIESELYNKSKTSPKLSKFYSVCADKVGNLKFSCNPIVLLKNLKEFVKTPVPIGFNLTCKLVRDKAGLDRNLYPNYYMSLDLDTNEVPNILLMVSRKRKKSKTSNYLISVDPSHLKRSSSHYVGKLRSNMVGTQFRIYDSGFSPKKRVSNKIEPRLDFGSIRYEQNVLGLKGPRKMKLMIPKMMNESTRLEIHSQLPKNKKEKRDKKNYMCRMRNKTPLWNVDSQSYVLNFFGRVTHASVKNFQLITEEDEDYIILQFGRIDENEFTMDIRYPLCPLQALGIVLSSFDYKLACE